MTKLQDHRRRSFWLKTLHEWHWVSSALCLLGMLLFAVVFVAGWLFSTLGQMRNAMDERRHLLQGFLFVVFGIYFSWFWARGQTLAMKTWNLRLVDMAGRPVTQLRALGRYALSWLWFLPPLAAIAPFRLSAGESVVILLGWVAVMMPPHAGLVLHGVLLVVCYLVDRRVYPVQGAAHWLTLRFRLSSVAALSCFLAAAGS